MTLVSALCTEPLTKVATLVKRREVSPVELTVAMLERIDRLDASLHSYITVARDLALQQALVAETEIWKGNYRGPLHGIPIAVKDLIYTKGVRTTCASKILADWVPEYDATVIEKLYAQGAVLLGKLTLTEFAGIGYHPSVPPASNPWDRNRWTGTSSSGSGVAMAGSLCFGALGTDTGGSIRFPAAACGVVGLKPTYGKVSKYGVFPLAESLDHVGPICRSVEDAAILLQAIAGFDPRDPTSRREPVPDYQAHLKNGISGVRIGLDRSYCSRADKETSDAIVEAATVLSEAGARIEEITFSAIEESIAAWGIIFTGECGASHEVTYPSRAADYSAPFCSFLENAEKLRGIDYAKAHAARQVTVRMIDDLFQKVDLLLCPTMGAVPMKLNGLALEDVITPEIGHDLLSFTSPFSLSGNPTISVPCGFSEEGLPRSLTLVGRHSDEMLILQAAHVYEQATPWHHRRPAI
ncbi:MAG: amidase [Pyrinomonadaceae bacterium]